MVDGESELVVALLTLSRETEAVIPLTRKGKNWGDGEGIGNTRLAFNTCNDTF